jgi:hypothetical protein
MAHLRALFGDALLQAHRELLDDLRKLREAAQATPPDRPADLAARVEAARADAAKHFRFEEENGYMTGVLEAQPYLERAVRHLEAEHGGLLASLDALLAETRSCRALTPELRGKVLDWTHALQRHERSENSLVQDAFNIDMTAED